MLAIVCFPQLLTVINRVCMAYEKRVPKVYVEILGSISHLLNELDLAACL
jgi:hypothetical protein